MRGFKWRDYLCCGAGGDFVEDLPLCVPVQPRKTPDTSHETVDIGQTVPTATKDMPAESSKIAEHAGSRSGVPQSQSRIMGITSNVTLVLGVVGEIVGVLASIPYIETAAGVIKEGMDVYKETKDCKEKWENVAEVLQQMDAMLETFKSHLQAQPSTIVEEAFNMVENCLKQVKTARDQYQDINTFVTILQWGVLTSEAQLYMDKIKEILNYFLEILEILRNPGPRQQNQEATVSDILPNPSPSQHFVGRQDTLKQLAKIFACPMIVISYINKDMLGELVDELQTGHTLILLDASNSKALRKSLAEKEEHIKSPKSSSLLVLQDADPTLVSELQEYFPNFPQIPIIVTSSGLIKNDFASHALQDGDPRLIDTIINAVKELAKAEKHIVTVVASGGTGKTQLVLEFAKQNYYRFSNIWFFDATSDASLIADFKELGRAAGVSEDPKKAQAFLESKFQNFLCIFDNADDKKVDLHKYIPRGKNGNVIITSRILEVAQMASPGCHIAVNDLYKEDAITLLLGHAHIEDSDTNREQGSKIVDAFECHALAVSSAGAYIQAFKTCTLSDYLSVLNNKQKESLDYQMKSLDGYSKSVYSAFILSFEKLSTQAQHLLQMCSFLHHTAIPVQLFVNAAADHKRLQPSGEDSGLELLEHFFSLFLKESSWYDTVDELAQLCIATYDNNTKTLSLHTVIHACAHVTVAPIEEEKTSRATTLLLGQATPEGEKITDYAFRRQLLPHANHLRLHIGVPSYIASRIGLIFRDAGFWRQCEEWEIQALNMYTLLGKNHPDTLSAMASLAFTYWSQGNYDAAEKLAEEVLELRRLDVGEHHPDTLLAMANLAFTYQSQGNYDAAKRLGEEVLELRRLVVGEQHPDTLSAMANLASTYQSQGRMEAATMLGE
ncbi:hypothetical protein EV368DRAFT_88278 [Lentinula lateritia]|nr:hypothetical protein EV368DRAFT_88278 [Lentinula lateritia]